jgi:hypothetical protein
MDLDWCTDESLSNAKNFNENLVINKEKKQISNTDKDQEKNYKDINVDECFSLDLEVKDSKGLLTILNYLSVISNYLRTFIRNKSTKFNEFTEINENEYELICKYLSWLHKSSVSIKTYFSVPLRRDNSYDPNTIKLFKTSSYKFCNFKESCSIHKNKNKCDKNHFVFDMIINDIFKLIESINIVGIHNINWILSNKIIKISFFEDDKKYIVEKINNTGSIGELDENQFIIDKTLIFKSFDVISYVLNKMYDESYCFLNFEVESHLININVNV